MPLWGATDSDESKPKNLTTAQKKQVFANASGWVLEAGSALSGNDNTDADPEILVAIGELSTSIGAADITEVEMVTTTADKSEGLQYQLELDITNQLMLLQQVVHQHSQLQIVTLDLDQEEAHTHYHTHQELVRMN